MRVIAGIQYFSSGLKLISQPGLRRFVVIPLSINMLVFISLITVAVMQFQRLLDFVNEAIPEWLAWLEWLLWPLFILGLVLVIFYTFTLVANLIAAPFNSTLAEAVEKQLSGQELDSGMGFWQSIKTIPRSLMDTVSQLLYVLMWSIPLLILYLIPVLNLLAPIVWFIFSAWLMAIEYGSYPMGNHEIYSKEQRAILKSKPGYSLGYGIVVMVATMIPVLNLFAMPAAVAGATRLWHEQLRDSHTQLSNPQA